MLDECATVIGQIAATGAFDDEARRHLSILDSRLRVRMQVDPQSDGAFAVWAMEIAEGIGQRGCVALVTGINASSDQRAIPGSVRSIVDQVLALARRDRAESHPRGCARSGPFDSRCTPLQSPAACSSRTGRTARQAHVAEARR